MDFLLPALENYALNHSQDELPVLKEWTGNAFEKQTSYAFWTSSRGIFYNLFQD
jgi:hypothetical protein